MIELKKKKKHMQIRKYFYAHVRVLYFVVGLLFWTACALLYWTACQRNENIFYIYREQRVDYSIQMGHTLLIYINWPNFGYPFIMSHWIYTQSFLSEGLQWDMSDDQ